MKSMKKTLLLLLLCLMSVTPLFAKEGDVHVTKTTPAVLNFDAGATVSVPFDSDKSKSFGLFGGVAFTPAGFSKFNAGIKGELSLNGFRGDDSKKIGATALVLARMYIEKSFEVYGGLGARYAAWDVESLTEFSHSWGIVLQGGARGRVLNWLGVGVQGSFLKGFNSLPSALEISIYGSIEAF